MVVSNQLRPCKSCEVTQSGNYPRCLRTFPSVNQILLCVIFHSICENFLSPFTPINFLTLSGKKCLSISTISFIEALQFCQSSGYKIHFWYNRTLANTIKTPGAWIETLSFVTDFDHNNSLNLPFVCTFNTRDIFIRCLRRCNSQGDLFFLCVIFLRSLKLF